jgi:hypothetical protein
MPLDAAAWKYRKPVLVREPGVQGLDLGLDVLAHSQPGLPDLRLLRAGLQVPFILEQTSELIVLNPRLESAPDAKRPSLSRWALRLPYPCLPVTSLSCRSSARLFQRDVLLYEYLRDAYGTATRRVLAQGHWRRTPEDAPGILTLSLAAAPQSDHLILETDNGDNPPLHLDRFEFVYPLSRLCFKTSAASALQLYYGNPAAASPRYDLSLVAPQLLAAPRKAALLGREELLKGSAWPRTFEAGGAARLLFWAVLALVVAGLVFVILRVLPRRPES